MSGLFLLGAAQSNAQLPLHKKKKINKSTAADNTAEPDKVLYDRAMDDIKHGRHEVGRLNFQTLINTYPDSEYLAKAKLAIADSFYKEGGTANLTQAVQSYKDFDIFFPMLPEAAYAQLQCAMTHYKQMEMPDRDRTQALAAEDEFQTFLAKYPNDPLVPKAEQHLREVQEILAEGDFRIGTYYYLKQPQDKKAAESRLKAVVNRYPLYSKSDQALWMLGNIWQSTEKKEFAVPYYARIVRNYPLSPLVPEAKKRLTALGAPIPQPDPEAVAWMTAEQRAPRAKEALYKKLMAPIHSGPTQEIRVASTSGKPNMTPESEAEGDILTGGNQSQVGGGARTGVVVTVTPGSAGATASGESVTPATEGTDANATAQPDPNAAPAKESSSSTAAPATTDAAAKTDAPAATATQPASDTAKTDGANATAGQATDATKTDGSTSAAQGGAQNSNDDNKKESSSKKKKGLKKLIPW